MPDSVISACEGAETRVRHAFSELAWLAFCVSVIMPALVVDSVPFAGFQGIFAAGGRYALRVAALGVPAMISLAAWSLAVMREGLSIRRTPFLFGLGWLAILAVLSTITAMDPRVALFGFWIDEQGLLMWLFYGCLAFLGSQLVTSRGRLLQLTWTVVLAGAVIASIALLEVIGVRLFGIPGEEWAYNRGVSTMMNPDFLGTFLVLPALLGSGLGVASQGWRRFAAVGAASLMFASLMLTLTRGAWAGAAIGLAVQAGLSAYGAIRRRRAGIYARDKDGGGGGARAGRWLLLATPAVVAVLALGAASVTSRIQSTVASLGDLDVLLSGRLGIWQEVAAAVLSKPWLGAGPANTLYAWQRFAGEGTMVSIGSGALIDSAHNIALDLAVQFGIPFAVLVIVGGAWLSVRVGRVMRNQTSTDPINSRLLIAWLSGGIALAVSLLAGVIVVPVVTIGAGAVGVLLASDGKTGIRSAGPYRYALAVVLVAAAVGAYWAGATGLSAIKGNQAAYSRVQRVQRNLVALDIAPWRMGPADDLVQIAPALTESEQSVSGMSAQEAYDLMLVRDGLNALTLYAAGDYYLTVERDTDKALDLCNRALELRPLFVPGIMLKGDVLAGQGRVDEATVLMERAVMLESKVRIAHAWEAPWQSYIGLLIWRAESDSGAASEVRDVYARFAERFPNSLMLRTYGEQIEALSP